MGIVFRLPDLCSLAFLIFIVYIVGKSLLILRNKTISLKQFFFFVFNFYPKIFLLSCIKNQVLWKFIALMNGLLVSEEFL